jgi:Co/Zn/Cd efflux system component
MDPAVGLIGAVVIAFWSFGLMRSAGRMLLDMVPESALSKRIIERLELKDDRVSDLHVWQVGPGHSAVIASLVTHEPEDPSIYKARLNGLHGLSHVTIEVHTCPGTH